MADVPSARAMEDFFINPTFPMQPHYQSDMSAHEQLEAIATSRDALSLKFGRIATPKPKATITDLREPVFWHGYASEEEAPSPVDNDDLSTHSGSEASDASLKSLPEALAATCHKVEHQCNRAQAVVLKPVGKARVIAVPKPVDITTQPCIIKPAGQSPNRRSLPQLSRLRIEPSLSPMPRARQIPTRQASQADHTLPEAITSSPEQSKRHRRLKSTGRLPSVPLMDAAAQAIPRVQAAAQSAFTGSFSRPRKPASSNTVGEEKSLKREMTPTDLRPHTPTLSPFTLVRRMNRFGSTINLKTFARTPSRSSTDSSSSDHYSLEGVKEPETVAMSTPRHARRLSMPGSKPKLVARGANERAPPITLPPFPGGDDADDDEPHWPLRKSSTTPMHLRGLPLSSNVRSARV